MTARVAGLALAALLAAAAPSWAQAIAPEGLVLPPGTEQAQAPAWPPQGATLLGELAWDDKLVPLVPPDEDPTPPTTTRGKWYTVSEWMLIGCHALDTAYTQRLVGTGRFHEANPFLGQFENPGLFVGVKFSIAFGQLKATRTIARGGHPVLAAVTNAAVGGVMCGAAWHNGRLYREDQQ